MPRPLVVLPVLAGHRAKGWVMGVEQLVVAALAPGNLMAEVARVDEDRPHCPAAPDASRTGMADWAGAGLTGARDAVCFQSSCDRAEADPGVGELEDPAHDRRGLWVGLESP